MFRFIIFLLPVFLFSNSPKLLLLNVYKNQDITGWVMSEKLDGIRAYWNGKQLISRSGKIINTPKWFIKNYPPFEIDGELWSKRDDFDNISSIVRDKIPTDDWKNIKHYIFEVPNAKGGLFERLNKVKPYENRYIKILKQIKIENKQHLNTFLDNVLAKKGEGVVVRDPNTSYINKRTSKALKVKKFYDAECRVLGYTQGKGKYSGMIGAIKCELSNGVKFKIGSGLTFDMRKSPPKIDSIITFKYQNLTKNGKPRFPIFLRIRESI
jgi:DNA ligase-1